jgi:hypothetical protein
MPSLLYYFNIPTFTRRDRQTPTLLAHILYIQREEIYAPPEVYHMLLGTALIAEAYAHTAVIGHCPSQRLLPFQRTPRYVHLGRGATCLLDNGQAQYSINPSFQSSAPKLLCPWQAVPIAICRTYKPKKCRVSLIKPVGRYLWRLRPVISSRTLQKSSMERTTRPKGPPPASSCSWCGARIPCSAV